MENLRKNPDDQKLKTGSKKKSRRSEIKGMENLRKNPDDQKLNG